MGRATGPALPRLIFKMKHLEDYSRWRKRKPKPDSDRYHFSQRLRKVRNLIQNREFAEALEILDSEAALENTGPKKTRILSLVGDSLARQGKTEEAVGVYKKAEAEQQEHPRGWLRPVVAQVRNQLRIAQTEAAFETARRGVARSLREERKFKKLLREINRQVIETGEVVILPRPYRASVVATRFGFLFLNEGELDAAKFFFEKVIQVNPKGGCRARLGMAEIALRTQSYDEAESWALDGISNGKFQAKTLSGWTLLLAARRGAGKTGVPAELLNWLSENADKAVGQRALQKVIEELRKSNDPLWRKMSERWLFMQGNKHPVLECHLKKLLLSDAKATASSPEIILNLAWSLWNTPKLSLREQISAARSIVECLLFLKKPVNEQTFITRTGNEFGKEGADRIRQATAELLFRAGHPKRAMHLNRQILDATPPGSKRWGKATWQLAEWKHEVGESGEAADLFLSVAEQDKTPERIRNFGLVQALRYAAVGDRPDVTQRAKPYLKSALGMIQDPELLLDMARQLGSAPDTRVLYQAFRKKGTRLILQAIRSAQKPSEAASLLFIFARRQNDWGDFKGTTDFWESLSEDKKQWLWTPKAEFWEYLAYVMRAYGWQDRMGEAEKLALEYVNDSATPSDGVAILGNSYAALLVYHERTDEALGVFERVIREAPQHPYAAYGYYWMGLKAGKAGALKQMAENALRMQKCLNSRSKLSWVEDLQMKSRIMTGVAGGMDLETAIDGLGLETAGKGAALRKAVLRDWGKLR